MAKISFPFLTPYFERSRGRGWAKLGKTIRAETAFTKAIRYAQSQNMDYILAKSLLDLSAIKENGRDENRLLAIKLLKKMESVIPRAESWLLGDQYDESVVAPEFDLAAWEAENGPLTPYLDSER